MRTPASSLLRGLPTFKRIFEDAVGAVVADATECGAMKLLLLKVLLAFRAKPLAPHVHHVMSSVEISRSETWNAAMSSAVISISVRLINAISTSVTSITSTTMRKWPPAL